MEKLTRKQKEIIRHRIYERSGGQCEECGAGIIEESGYWSSMHLSHTKSIGAGGDWSDDNLEALCLQCHLVGVHNRKSVPSKENPMKLAVFVLALCATAALAQTPQTSPEPKLSTADIIAINSIESQKQQLQQQEQSILQEWAQAHPGWRIMPFPPFPVVKDQPPAAPAKK